MLLSLREALSLVAIAVPKNDKDTSTQRSEPDQDQLGSSVPIEEAGEAPLPTQAIGDGKDFPKEPLRGLVAALARGFGLQLPSEVSLLDQLLEAKQQLNQQQVSAADVEHLLQNEFPISEHAWADALQKVLLVLRLPTA